MRRLEATLVILTIATTPLPCLAQFGGGFVGGVAPGNNTRFFCRMETIGGNILTGAVLDHSLKIKSEELGELRVTLPALKSIDFGDEGDTIITLSGATIKGKVAVEEFKIRSEFGTLTLKRSQLKSIRSFTGEGPDGFVGSYPLIDLEPEPAAEGPAAPRPSPPADKPAAPKPAAEAPSDGPRTGEAKTASPATERPSRPSPIPRTLLRPGRG